MVKYIATMTYACEITKTLISPSLSSSNDVAQKLVEVFTFIFVPNSFELMKAVPFASGIFVQALLDKIYYHFSS